MVYNGGISITGNSNISGYSNIASYTYGQQLSLTGSARASSLYIIGGGIISTTGSINVTGTGVVSVVANIRGGNLSAVGNIQGNNLSAVGNIQGNNLIVSNSVTVNSAGAATAIQNGGTNAVGNIGSDTGYFNQVFAQATTALYADLAEVYAADADYPPGTVVVFGGDKEVTIALLPGDPKVAGVISEKPSYLMNNGLTADHRATVALTGRVPTLVYGPVVKGDMMISAGNGYAQSCCNPAMGTVIGKALHSFDGKDGTIEIVVGRM